MRIHRLHHSAEVSRAAAADVAGHLREVIATRGMARIVAATGVSQIGFLDSLAAAPQIAWSQVSLFHLDEYIGLSATHPASFRRYLHEHLIDRVHPGAYALIEGDAADAAAECRRVGALIQAAPVDAAFVGIGENGHLAFNDPPADFEVTQPYIVVDLDETCRGQQVREGWFASLTEVPSQAISMSIQQIMAARKIFCLAPEARKAQAVRACLEDDISPWRPASILRRHGDVEMYLDPESASLLSS